MGAAISEARDQCAGCFRSRSGPGRCVCGYEDNAPISASVLPPGSRLSSPDRAHQYVLGNVLGTGAFATTYLAKDLKNDQRVAIKEFLPRDLAGRASGSSLVRPNSRDTRPYFEHGLARFINETQALSQFDHPNIVGVEARFEANDTAYLVMPYYDAITLGDYVDEHGAMAPEVALSVMVAVLDGLRHIHATKLEGRRWTHRDVKPDNILLRRDSTPLLIDFGAARTEALNEKRALSVVLTPGFAPYEQHIPGERSDGPWVDVYGAAATLYHAVTGRQPVDARIRYDELREHKKPDPLVAPSALNPKVSPQLSRAIMRGMALDFRDRPADAAAFSAVLKRSGPGLEDIRYALAGFVRGPWGPRLALVATTVALAGLGFAYMQLRQDLQDSYASYKAENTQLKAERDKLLTLLRTYQSKSAVTAAGAEELALQAESDKAQLEAQLATVEIKAQETAEEAEAKLAEAARLSRPERLRAQSLLAGAQTIRVRSTDPSGLISQFDVTLAVRGSEVQGSSVEAIIEQDNSAPRARDIQRDRAVRVFLSIRNDSGKEIISGWSSSVPTSGSGPARVTFPDVLKISGPFPCTADELADKLCRVGLFAGSPSSTVGTGQRGVIEP